MKKALSITTWLGGVVLVLIIGVSLFYIFGAEKVHKGEVKETLFFSVSEIWDVVVDTGDVEVLESDANGALKWEKDGATFERWKYDPERGYVVKMISSDSGTTGLWTYELTPYGAGKTMVRIVVDVDVDGLFGGSYATAEDELARIKGVLE